MPEQCPGGQYEEKGGAQRLLDRAANVADGMAAAATLIGDQWCGGCDKAHAEYEQGLEQVDGERARRHALRAQTADQQ